MIRKTHEEDTNKSHGRQYSAAGSNSILVFCFIENIRIFDIVLYVLKKDCFELN